MSLSYSTYVAALANMMGQTLVTDPNFLTMIPSAIDYAEQRIYRELDLLETITRDTGNTTPNSRNFTLPQNNGRFTVLEGANLSVGGIRVASLLPVSRDFIDLIYPSDTPDTSPSYPMYFSMLSDQNLLLAPSPDGVYAVEVIGHIRPSPLSASNTSSILSTYFPDLLLAASMIFASGYQHNFGSQGDDPKMSQSWESQYGALIVSAETEQTRKRFFSAAWSSKRVEPTPAPVRS